MLSQPLRSESRGPLTFSTALADARMSNVTGRSRLVTGMSRGKTAIWTNV